MSIERRTVTRLRCDLCPDTWLGWNGNLPKVAAEQQAREKGWRKDKLGRNVCPAHPKLKGAR